MAGVGLASSLSDRESVGRAVERSGSRQDFRFQGESKLLTSSAARFIASMSLNVPYGTFLIDFRNQVGYIPDRDQIVF
jgi:hypothetical protein